MLVMLFGACIATPWIATHDPIKQSYRERLAPPSKKHYLGTDRLGRDIYSRLLWGGRRLVTIALLAVAFGLSIGIPYGVLSGYFGGKVDTVAMRVVDGLLAFPGLLLYLLIVTLAREWKLEGIYNDLILVFALGFAFTPEVARLVARHGAGGETEGICRGFARHWRRQLQHRAQADPAQHHLAADRECHGSPGLCHPDHRGAVVPRPGHAAADTGLGLRSQRRARLHGNRAADRRLPGLAICYTVLAFNLFGDGLRDILDPRLAER